MEEVTITFSDNEQLEFNCNKCNEITITHYCDENYDLGNCTSFPFLTCTKGHVFFFDDKHDPSENYLYNEKVVKKYKLLKIKGIWSDLSEDQHFKLSSKNQSEFEENFKDTHIEEFLSFIQEHPFEEVDSYYTNESFDIPENWYVYFENKGIYYVYT